MGEIQVELNVDTVGWRRAIKRMGVSMRGLEISSYRIRPDRRRDRALLVELGRHPEVLDAIADMDQDSDPR